MPQYDYRIATGHGVALGSLTNVETLLTLAPVSALVDPYPVRVRVLSGREYGHGTINLTWRFRALPVAYFKVIEDTFHTSGTVVSAAVTIYTRRANRATYTRYNAWSILPQPEAEYTYNERFVYDLEWRFTGLVAL